MARCHMIRALRFVFNAARLSLSLWIVSFDAAYAEDAALSEVPPVTVRDGVAKIRAKNLVQADPGEGVLVRVVFPDGAPEAVLGEENGLGPAAALLRRLYSAGQAAGHHGDLYDNRDRAHSLLPRDLFPQLGHIVYGPRLRAAGLDFGAAGEMIFDAPVIGNSSTALTSGSFWRSQPRLFLTTEEGPSRLWQGYRAGHLYVYPEHYDHDPERGDLLPANTPYYLISQGSSGSDQAHLRALALILAAFQPDTKAVLLETGLLAPTIQMVYRRNRKGVLTRADYLNGAAHPSVFDADGIALGRMVAFANAIGPDEVPPLVRLKVLDESHARNGVDFVGNGRTERLFDTPSAIARVWRSKEGRRVLVVSAARTRDPNGRDLSFEWVLLRGDPDRVWIVPSVDGRQARIEFEWQGPRPVPGRPEIVSHRIDIGIFANNGAYDSAPAFVSVLLPRHEQRIYEAGPNGAMRILSVKRAVTGEIYADPALFPEQDWRDIYSYDANGKLIGWIRQGDEDEVRYDSEGRLVTQRTPSPE